MSAKPQSYHESCRLTEITQIPKTSHPNKSSAGKGPKPAVCCFNKGLKEDKPGFICLSRPLAFTLEASAQEEKCDQYHIDL